MIRYLHITFLMIAVGFVSYAQTGRLTISGNIFDSKGKEIRDAQIEVYRADSMLVVDTVCDKLGLFSITVDYDYLYFVIVSKLGYSDKTFQINGAGLFMDEKLADQQVEHLKIELKPGRSQIFTEPTGIIMLNYYSRKFDARMVTRPDEEE